MSEKKQFTRSNGKVKQLGCPYEDDSEVIELTAEQFARSRNCQCSYCWANRPTYGWAEIVRWTDEEANDWRYPEDE